MPTPQDKLAESLAVLKKLQDQGIVAIQTKNMTRTHWEHLVKTGFIKRSEERMAYSSPARRSCTNPLRAGATQ